MAVTLQAWVAALQAMLPPGRAFTRESDSVLTKVLSAIAAMFLATQLKLEALLEQADPRRATSMLSDWERCLGLPDHCTPAGQQLADRQRAAFQRLTEQGGQSRPYFSHRPIATGRSPAFIGTKRACSSVQLAGPIQLGTRRYSPGALF